MKESSILSLKNIILTSSDYKTYMKALNLDINSTFLLTLNFLEDSLIDYNPLNDYEYLNKTSSYLKKIYSKLSKNKKALYKEDIIRLKKIYRKCTKLVEKYDIPYFKNIYMILENLISNKVDINIKEEIVTTDDDLYQLLSEAIFTFESLEYLDLLIEKCPSILNAKKEGEPIFIKVLEKYLDNLKNNSQKSDYYFRVINKFFHEKSFELTNQMQENVLKKINDFINKKPNIKSNDLNRIKQLVLDIKKQDNLEEYDIKNYEYQLTEKDLNYLENSYQSNKHRVRLNEYIITIDDEDSEVLDDGISVQKLSNGNLLFKVHIADPLAIFPYNSDLMQDAKTRSFTIYDKVTIPMIPWFLSTDRLSLCEGKERYAKTFCIEYSKDYGIVDFRILNTIITINERRSYKNFNELHKNGGSNIEQDNMLKAYDEILLYLKNLFKGAQAYEKVKSNNIIGHNQKIEGFAESLISYLMMLVGYKTAECFSNQSLPYAFRCHQIDSKWQEFLNNLIADPNNEEYKKMLREIKGNFPKSFYSRINVGHMGLKLPYYSHTTSPLRRFADDLNFHVIDTCYFKAPSDKTIYQLEHEIDSTCDYINLQSNSIDEYFSKIKMKK